MKKIRVSAGIAVLSILYCRSYPLNQTKLRTTPADPSVSQKLSAASSMTNRGFNGHVSSGDPVQVGVTLVK